MPFITDEVKAKRAANLKETEERMETFRRNEVSRFLEEGISTLCEKVREAAVNEYLMKGELPGTICVYDHDRLITQAVANSHSSVVRHSLRSSRASKRRFVTLNSDT